MINNSTGLAKIITKAIMDTTFRQQFLADPMGTAEEFGLSEYERNQLAKYDARKLKVLVEGPSSHA